MLLWLGMLFPSSARKASTVAFGLGNISKEKKILKRKQSKKKKLQSSCVLGSLLRDSHSHIILSIWNMYTKGKENTWLLCVYRSRVHHTSMGNWIAAQLRADSFPKHLSQIL